MSVSKKQTIVHLQKEVMKVKFWSAESYKLFRLVQVALGSTGCSVLLWGLSRDRIMWIEKGEKGS